MLRFYHASLLMACSSQYKTMRKCSGNGWNCSVPVGYRCRKVMRPFVRSYGDNSSVTLSPANTRIRFRRNRPAKCANTTRSCSSCTLNRPLGNFSNTVPVTSMLSSLLINLRSGIGRVSSYERGADCHSYRRHPAGWLRGRGDVRGLQAFGPLSHLELHLGTFIQGTVALRLNCREMYEHILAILTLDKSISLGRVEPLYCAFFFHLLMSL